MGFYCWFLLVGCRLEDYRNPYHNIIERIDNLTIELNKTLEMRYDLGYVNGFIDCQNDDLSKVELLKEKYGTEND